MKVFIVLVLAAIDAADRAYLGPVPRKHFFECVGDLADSRPRPCRFNCQCQEIAVAALRGLGQRGERRFDSALIAQTANALEPLDLLVPHCRVVDIEQFDFGRLAGTVFVDPDDRLFAAVDARLAPRRGLFYAQFRHARLDGLGHAAQCLDLGDQLHCRGRDRMRQALDVIAAAERIDDVGMPVSSARINWVLRASRAEDGVGNARASSKELVCSDCVPPSTAANRLECRADDVVVRVLLGEAHARGLAVRAQCKARRVVRRELLHQLRPETRAARSFAISMKKFMPIPKKNDSRGANSSTQGPATGRRARIRARRPR